MSAVLTRPKLVIPLNYLIVSVAVNLMTNQRNQNLNRFRNTLGIPTSHFKWQSYIEKVKEISAKRSSKIAEVKYIIIYTRRDRIPITPILRSVDTVSKNHAVDNGSNPTRGILNKAPVSLIENRDVNPDNISD